jgi:protein TonB
MPEEAVTLFVNFIAPAAAPRAQEATKSSPPKPRPVEKPQPQQLVAETPTVAPGDYVAPPPPRQAVAAIEASSGGLGLSTATGPQALGSELSVTCPERTPPSYPPVSRRLNEEGTVILRVELDERGQVAIAKVATASGYPRLDEAALSAIRSWRCAPVIRNGQPVRSIALQPFKFILQGN